MTRLSEDEVWFWYQHIETWKKSDMKYMEYCKTHNLDFTKFKNMQYRIYHKRQDKEAYDKQVSLGRSCLSSGLSTRKFCKQNDTDEMTLKNIVLHLRYKDTIDRLLQEKGITRDMPIQPEVKQELTFKRFAAPQPIPQAEVVEQQNDIEITITKGVKVSIAPSVDPMKIIKIIELLKDL